MVVNDSDTGESRERDSSNDLRRSGPSAKQVGVRLLWGISIGGICVGLLAYGSFTLLIAAVLVGILGLQEFFRLTKVDQPKTIFPLRRLGYIFVTVLLILTYLEPRLGSSYLEFLLVIFIISTFVYQMGRFAKEKANFLYELAITLLGSVYIGGLLSFVFKLKNLGEGYTETFPQLTDGWAFLPLIPLIGAWAYDSSAFFSGVLFGKIKLMPSVSPKKTVEGAIGGLIGTGTALMVFGFVSGVTPEIIPFNYIFALGVVLGVLSQVGDLCVSALKREMLAKDASTLIPGHGGILDKIDGLLFCLPATYYVLSMFLEMKLRSG